MTKIIKGFILSLNPYLENDVIANVLTKDGFESFKVRAGQKTTSKFINSIACFEYGEFSVCSINNSDKYFLQEVNNVCKINDLYSNIDKNILISFIAESIIKDESLTNSYSLYEYVFNAINENKFNFANIICIVLKLHLLSNGSFVETDGCINCGSKKNIVGVSLLDGGFICSSCFNNSGTLKSIQYLKTFRMISKANIVDQDKFNIDEIIKKEMISDFFHLVEENVGIKLLTKKLILDIL